ncbi:MAG: hypothetical protein KGM43_06785 [Planctomycetota bacterium]|nr:hypothetical protein [Planctomycetota bacterium]
MKVKMAVCGLSLSLMPALVGSVAEAQLFRKRAEPAATATSQPSSTPASANGPAPAATSGSDAKNDPTIKQGVAYIPEPSKMEEMQSAKVDLPAGPIEPYLLTKQNGPFMVMAKTFRGPDAERYALALVLELRRDYQLPAYVLRKKDFPGQSNIREVPPTAREFMNRPNVGLPEKYRTFDEATVLVGDEKTEADADRLLKRVKKIHPLCLKSMPSIYHWRQGDGLKTGSFRTTNPFIPTQYLFPRKPDALVQKINGGAHSIYSCPGRYTLQIVQFQGRMTFDADDPKFHERSFLRKSPLLTAHEDAEKLADKLSKDPQVMATGYQPYVYHDRVSSRVTIGSFDSPNDPRAAKLRETMTRLASDLISRKVTEEVIAPSILIDLEDPQNPVRPPAQGVARGQ